MNELYHYGVLGMKWGVRRYQPYSVRPRGSGERGKEIGKARKAGKRLLRSSEKREVPKALQQNIKAGKDKSPISPAEKVTKEASKIADSGKGIASSVRNIKRRNAPAKDLSSMTDQELRQKINRMDLERRYNDLTSGDTSKGFDNAMDVLDIAGDIVGIAGGTVGIIAAIYALNR